MHERRDAAGVRPAAAAPGVSHDVCQRPAYEHDRHRPVRPQLRAASAPSGAGRPRATAPSGAGSAAGLPHRLAPGPGTRTAVGAALAAPQGRCAGRGARWSGQTTAGTPAPASPSPGLRSPGRASAGARESAVSVNFLPTPRHAYARKLNCVPAHVCTVSRRASPWHSPGARAAAEVRVVCAAASPSATSVQCQTVVRHASSCRRSRREQRARTDSGPSRRIDAGRSAYQGSHRLA